MMIDKVTERRFHTLRTPAEIAKMRRAGLVVWESHQAAYRLLQPGITTGALNAAIRDTFVRHQAHPLFLNYPGPVPFPAESCISINEQLVHGIPGDRVVKLGDIVSIDTGCRLDGWCGDAAITHAVGAIPGAVKQLLKVTLGALNLAITQLQTAKRWSEVAVKMEEYVVQSKLCVVEEMVGHGIGRNLHEPPQVPNYYSPKWALDHDFPIQAGLVIAVEPMVMIGTKGLRLLKDGWTQIADNRRHAAHFEHTIAITADGPVRLTGAPTPDEFEFVSPEFRDPKAWIQW